MAAAAAAGLVILPNASPKPYIPAIKSRISHTTRLLFVSPLLGFHKNLPSRPCSAVQDIAVDDEAATETEEGNDAGSENKRKLYLVNLPWGYSAPDIEKLLGECGTVKRVEIIKQKNGKSRGFAFVVMASGEEAQAVVEKFNSHELLGRTIRVEFAKSFRKPSPPAPPALPSLVVAETRHTIYASNLAWKVRSTNLKEFFSSKFKPVSARVVFDDRKSAGYGFISFATKEEAEAAFSELDGKELMGRPLRLKMRETKGDESGSEPEEAGIITEGHSKDI